MSEYYKILQFKERDLKMDKYQDVSSIKWGLHFQDKVAWNFLLDGKYYKAILPCAEKHILELLNTKIYQELCLRRMFIPLFQCDFLLQNFSLIFCQSTDVFHVPHKCYSFSMHKDTVLTFLRINKFLLEHNFSLSDGHQENFVLHGYPAIPMLCDLGSLRPLPSAYYCTDIAENIEQVLYPLLIRSGSPELGLILLQSPSLQNRNVFLSSLNKGATLRKLLPRCAKFLLKIGYYFSPNIFFKKTWLASFDVIGWLDNILLFNTREQALNLLEDFVQSLRPHWKKTKWNDYHEDYEKYFQWAENHDNGKIPNRIEEIFSLLETFQVKTAIDIGSNMGVFSWKLAKQGINVLALDSDEEAIDKLYIRCRGNNQNISLKMGVKSFLDINEKAELVLALAITHHLYFSELLSLHAIVERLANATEKVLVTEFMPYGLRGTPSSEDIFPPEYHIDHFVKLLAMYFDRVQTKEYQLKEANTHRILVVCEGKKACPKILKNLLHPPIPSYEKMWSDQQYNSHSKCGFIQKLLSSNLAGKIVSFLPVKFRPFFWKIKKLIIEL